MPVVKIVDGQRSGDGKVAIGYGTRIFLDGVELQGTTDIQLHFGLDDAVRCNVKMLVLSPFEFEASVDAHLHVTHYYGQEEIKAICALLVESRRVHYHCDDSFYCCPKCASTDHDSCGGDADRDTCTCGADEWNRKVEEALK